MEQFYQIRPFLIRYCRAEPESRGTVERVRACTSPPLRRRTHSTAACTDAVVRRWLADRASSRSNPRHRHCETPSTTAIPGARCAPTAALQHAPADLHDRRRATPRDAAARHRSRSAPSSMPPPQPTKKPEGLTFSNWTALTLCTLTPAAVARLCNCLIHRGILAADRRFCGRSRQIPGYVPGSREFAAAAAMRQPVVCLRMKLFMRSIARAA